MIPEHTITVENLQLFKGYGHYYTTSVFLDYVYSLKNYYKIITIELRKRQALDADQKAVQEVSFTGNLDRTGNTTLFFITNQEKETKLYLSRGNVGALQIFFALI